MTSEIKRAFEWMFSRDTGMSSKAIMGHMMAGISDGEYPSDPSDLGRCLRLLDKFPDWEPRIAEMAKYGPEWEQYAANWPVLKASYLSEVGDLSTRYGWSAPRTYAMMKSMQKAAAA